MIVSWLKTQGLLSKATSPQRSGPMGLSWQETNIICDGETGRIRRNWKDVWKAGGRASKGKQLMQRPCAGSDLALLRT